MPSLPAPPSPAPKTASTATAVASVAVVVAIFAAIFLVARDAAERRNRATPAAADVARTATDEARPVSSTMAIATGRLAGFAVVPADLLTPPVEAEGRFETHLRPAPPYDAIDSTLIDSGDGRIRLIEALAVGRHDVCRRSDGSRFACGLEARARLQNGLIGKQLVCDRLFVAVDRRNDFVPARCRVDGRDLALTMIEAGYAFAPPLAGGLHTRAEAAAKAAGRGVWAGTPTRPDLDPAIVDDQAVAVGSTRLGGVAPAAEPPAQP